MYIIHDLLLLTLYQYIISDSFLQSLQFLRYHRVNTPHYRGDTAHFIPSVTVALLRYKLHYRITL